MLNRLLEIITEQQKGHEDSMVYEVGEQLKEICRMTPETAELLAQDLLVPEMSIVKVKEKIDAYAGKKKRTGNSVCVTTKESDKILREFYGLPDAETAEPTGKATEIIDLNDFF